MKKHTTTDNSRLTPHNGAETAQVNTTTPIPTYSRGDIQNSPPAKEGLGVVFSNPEEPGEVLLPYVAPAIEVIEVRTEAGYALSGKPGPWDPTDW